MAQRIVGLDIGTSAVRAVELSVDSGHRAVLEAFGQVGLPPGVVVDGGVVDQAHVAAALRRLWKEGGFSERRVYLGVAGTRAITRELELPPVPPDELDDAVRLQADDVVPFPVDQTVISAAVTAQVSDGEGATQLRVLAAAAHRELIDSVVSAVEAADLEPIGIDLNSAALARTFTDPEATAPDVVVSIGAGLTMVVAHHQGVVLFIRTINLGGDAITQAIAGALDVPVPDAENIKRQLAVTGYSDERAIDAALFAVDELVGEIHSSVRFYSTLPGRSAPGRVLLTGSAARTVGLVEKLQHRLDVPVQLASSLATVDASRLPISPSEAAGIDPAIPVSVGLAMQTPGATRFNLLPKEITGKYAERRVRRMLLVAAAVLFVALIGATAWRILSIRSTEHDVSALNSQLHYIQTVEIPKYDKAVHLANQATKLQSTLKPLVANEVDWLVVLNQLGQYLPPNAVVSTLTMTASSAPGQTSTSTAPTTADGKAIGTGQATITVPAFPEVTTFGQTMGKSPVVLNVTVTGNLSTSNASVTFPATFAISQLAHSQRLSLFSQRIP